ncbi:hypothetical protein MASR1M36_09020 [Candidatus Cloacimonadaceae bacterium]
MRHYLRNLSISVPVLIGLPEASQRKNLMSSQVIIKVMITNMITSNRQNTADGRESK